MENPGRGERMVRIFVYLMAHYNNRYSVTDIMQHLDIPASELRSVQRDMQALTNLESRYIQRITDSGKTYYQAALERANKLVFPEFGDMVLHFVFLQRIANLYPATASLIDDLTRRITQDLPAKQQDILKSYSKELSGRILFMGTPPNYDEDVSKHLPTILNAIRQKRKVQIKYTDNWGTPSDKPRVPLMIAISHGDIYIGCVSQHHPDKTYALKLQRIESVKLLKETFEEDSKVVESLRKRIRTGSLLLGEQNPQEEKVVIYFPKYAKNFLKERPYHRSMEMEDAPGDEIRVTMKVEVNELLKQWIMYYGNIATVEQPKKLRQMILETAKQLVEKYEK